MQNKQYPHNIIQSILSTLFIFMTAVPLFLILNFINIPEDIKSSVLFIISVSGAIIIIHIHNKKKYAVVRHNFRLQDFSLLLLLIGATIVFIIGLYVPFNKTINTVFRTQDAITNPFENLLFFAGAISIGPILEEILFRGMILRGLLTTKSPISAILISSLLFGVIHIKPIQIINGFILGLFIGWIYYKTRSIGVTIIIHSISNLTVVICNYLFFKFGNQELFSVKHIYGNLTLFLIIPSCALLPVLVLLILKKTRNKPI